MWPVDVPPRWVYRSRELAALGAGVDALRDGRGSAVWVEGEPGIGKSSLVAQALAAASEPGWDVGWGIADELAERLPLSVIPDCLQGRLRSAAPARPTGGAPTPPACCAASVSRCSPTAARRFPASRC